MVSEKKIAQCAKNIVEAMNLKKCDAVLIQGGVHTQRLLERCGIEVMSKGGSPMITSTTDEYMKEMFREVPKDSFEVVPKHVLAATKALDVNLRIEQYDDPSIAQSFPEDKVKARMQAMLPINEVVHDPENGKKWLYAGWPTKGMAKMYGLDYKKLEKFIIDGMLISFEELSSTGKKIAGGLSSARYVQVSDSAGTEIKLDISGRRTNISDGFISDEDVAKGQRGSNLPTGEVYYAPHEDSGEGTLYCPLTTDPLSKKIVKDVELRFRDGKLDLDKCSGAGFSEVRKTLEQMIDLDKKKFDVVRTTNVAELGIGYNRVIDDAIGYILTDEKIGGTAHVALGNNNSYGGTSRSSLHWDFVTKKGVTIKGIANDGRSWTVIEDGKVV